MVLVTVENPKDTTNKQFEMSEMLIPEVEEQKKSKPKLTVRLHSLPRYRSVIPSITLIFILAMGALLLIVMISKFHQFFGSDCLNESTTPGDWTDASGQHHGNEGHHYPDGRP
ncbi:uncharacterized protein LOC117299593 [Asterias rubens]|uniref:uncharacterized protein LOC117299593 n=1 Tax=Asterias rubens TaxID=7604 RepID=UPI001454EEBB|nr:uncharacterized protein LOC117299593 [Asterias rubens]